MKRRITLSIALALSIISVTLMSSDRTAQAQSQVSFFADTGVIKLGPNQILRITLESSTGDILIKFRRFGYEQAICSGDGICRLTVVSQTTSNPIMLMPGEAASMDLAPMPNSSGVRGVVLSNRREIKVNAMIVNTATGQVEGLLLDVILHEN